MLTKRIDLVRWVCCACHRDPKDVAGGIANTSGVRLHIWLHSRVPSCAIQPEQHDIS